MFSHKSELEISAEKALKKVMCQMKLPYREWSLTQLSKREDQKFSGITYLAEHSSGFHYVFKYQLKPYIPEGFASHFELQAEAYRKFKHTSLNTLPEPIYVDSECQASLVSYIDGRPLSDHMREVVGDKNSQLNLLRRAGAWLDAFHRCQVDEFRRFNTGYTVKYYQKLQAKIKAGDIEVAAKPLLMQGIDHLVSIAPNFNGCETISASQHGDFHMRNLIVSGKLMAGIDISKSDPAPVGYDIAKILLDYTSVIRSANELLPGKVVPEDASRAFFAGYKLVDQSDPSVNFLLYARILATLMDVPKKMSERTNAKLRTLNRLRPIAKNAFDGSF